MTARSEAVRAHLARVRRPQAPAQHEAPALALPRGVRERLPGRRAHSTDSICVGGHKIKVQIGTRPDGTPCELFLRLHKEGAPVRALMNTIARLVSAGLQYGMPLAEIVTDLRAHEDGPALTVEDHETIRTASSLLDAIGQILATYPGGEKREEARPCG